MERSELQRGGEGLHHDEDSTAVEDALGGASRRSGKEGTIEAEVYQERESIAELARERSGNHHVQGRR